MRKVVSTFFTLYHKRRDFRGVGGVFNLKQVYFWRSGEGAMTPCPSVRSLCCFEGTK